MLYAFGPLAFEVHPYNVHEVVRETKTDFVEKGVLGARQPLEHVGEGAETIKLSGRILPARLPGGLEAHEECHRLREAAEAQMLLRGDGAVFGWFVIETVKESSKHLGPSGVGQVVEVEIGLKRADAPAPGAVFGLIASLLG